VERGASSSNHRPKALVAPPMVPNSVEPIPSGFAVFARFERGRTALAPGVAAGGERFSENSDTRGDAVSTVTTFVSFKPELPLLGGAGQTHAPRVHRPSPTPSSSPRHDLQARYRQPPRGGAMLWLGLRCTSVTPRPSVGEATAAKRPSLARKRPPPSPRRARQSMSRNTPVEAWVDPHADLVWSSVAGVTSPPRSASHPSPLHVPTPTWSPPGASSPSSLAWTSRAAAPG
jgi:hypothetical protein